MNLMLRARQASAISMTGMPTRPKTTRTWRDWRVWAMSCAPVWGEDGGMFEGVWRCGADGSGSSHCKVGVVDKAWIRLLL